jgi:formylglycine-generating enzyme required for sulfatase activity
MEKNVNLAQWRQAVVRVWRQKPLDKGEYLGSAFLISPVHIVTAKHVVFDAEGNERSELFLDGKILDQPTPVRQCISHPDKKIDMAVLVINEENAVSKKYIPELSYNYRKLESGEVITLVGFSTTDGGIECPKLNIQGYNGKSNAYMLTSPVAKGFSGGPALLHNQLVGVIWARDTDRHISYIMPFSAIRDFLRNYAPAPSGFSLRDLLFRGAGAFLAVAIVVGLPNAEPQRGDSFKDCEGCPEMVVVPKGRFRMGSPETEPNHRSEEGPQHQVTIDKPFAAGKYAVTVAQFEQFLNKTGRRISSKGCNYRRIGVSQSGAHPRVCVSWDDANAYVKWLSIETGKEYRLLTEAEREYVTRAGTETAFWQGDSITPHDANYDSNYVHGNEGGTLPVNEFRANAWGLYQVHGNVWEWTRDCWNDDYKNVSPNGLASTQENCPSHVVRGGSWHSRLEDLRAASRGKLSASVGNEFIGFRVMRALHSDSKADG